MQGVDLKKRVWEEYRRLPKVLQDWPIYLAVSSGKDSSVLAQICLQLRQRLPNLRWLHVNYRLRRPDSDREEEFLRDWAEREKVPFRCLRLSSGSKPGNLQAWARAQRLKFFAMTIAKEEKGRGIVWLAHHSQDQAETIVNRILRGSGLRGLGGMESLEGLSSLDEEPLVQPLLLFRPLLQVPQEAILLFLKKKKVRYCQDRSNLQDIYLRNRIRRHVLPLLLEENPRAIEMLNHLGNRARLASQALDLMAQAWLRHGLIQEGGAEALLLDPLSRMPLGFAQSILENFMLRHFSNLQGLGHVLIRVQNFLQNPRGKQKLPLKKGWEIHLDSEQIRIQQSLIVPNFSGREAAPKKAAQKLRKKRRSERKPGSSSPR